GSARRLRPLLTTAVTTIVGLVPLAVSSAFYRPLTLVIIFGLIWVSVLALFVVPALYLLLTPRDADQPKVLDWGRQWRLRWGRHRSGCVPYVWIGHTDVVLRDGGLTRCRHEGSGQ